MAIVKESEYVCGGQSRWLPDISGDDVALTGIKLKFCDWKIPKSISMWYDVLKGQVKVTPYVMKSSIFTNPTTTEQG